MGLEKEQKTGLSLQFFKDTWVVIGVFTVIAVVLIAGIVAIISKNGGDNENVSATGADTVTEIKIGSDVFFIPGSYKHKIEEDGSITLTDDPSNWVANIAIRRDVLYENFEPNFNALVESYKTNPKIATVVDSGVLEIGERNYFYIDVVGEEGSLTGSYAYVGYDNYVIEIVIEDAEGEIKHDFLEKLAPIIDGIKDNVRIEDAFADIVRNRVRLDLPTITIQGVKE